MYVQFQSYVKELPPKIEYLSSFPFCEFHNFFPSLDHSHVNILKSLLNLIFNLYLERMNSNADLQVFSNLVVIVIIDSLKKKQILTNGLIADVGLQPFSDNLREILFFKLSQIT